MSLSQARLASCRNSFTALRAASPMMLKAVNRIMLSQNELRNDCCSGGLSSSCLGSATSFHLQLGHCCGTGELASPRFSQIKSGSGLGMRLCAPSLVPGGDFFFWAQFSRKLARLYEYSYLGPVLYMNIHIAHDTKVFVTLRGKKKSNEISIPCPMP